MLVGPGSHFPPLFLRCSSLHRDFDVSYRHSLLFEHPPDVVPRAGRELGEVLRSRYPDVARYIVAALFGGQVACGGGSANLPGCGLGELAHGPGCDGGLPPLLLLDKSPPRDPPPEGDLFQEEEQGHKEHEDADDPDHGPGPGVVAEGGSEVAKRVECGPVVRAYLVRQKDAEAHQEEQHRHGYQEQGYDQHDQAVECVHFTLVFVWRGSDSRTRTLRLLTGIPASARYRCTRFCTSDLTLCVSSSGRTLALTSTLAPGLLWALAFTFDWSTSGSCSTTGATSLSTALRVMYVPRCIRTLRGVGGFSSRMSSTSPRSAMAPKTTMSSAPTLPLSTLLM